MNLWRLATKIFSYFLAATVLFCSPGVELSRVFNIPRSIRNCTDCSKPLGFNIQQLQRLQRIKQQILAALGFQNDQHVKRIPTSRSADVRKGPNFSIQNAPESKSPNRSGREIISFSETIGQDDSRLLQFIIDTRTRRNDLEVISAHLWVLVKKRGKHKSIKRIVLKVYQQDGDGQSLLTYLRTRVLRTKWQKLSLPISLVQSLMGATQSKLKLRIECRRCGRLVKLVLPRAGKRRGRQKVRTKVPSVRGLRHRKSRHGRKQGPILIINTRVKYSIKKGP